MTGIYKITSPSGKVYVGQSWEIEIRFRRYNNMNCKLQRKLYSSLLKYGPENHTFEIIHQLPSDIHQLIMNEYEKIYWQFYQDIGIEMMNLKEPGLGGKLSDETKRRIGKSNSLSQLGKIQSKETIEKRTSKTRGRKRSKEQRNRMSDSKKGRKLSTNHIENLKGKIPSKEARQKMREAKLGKIPSIESRTKMSESAIIGWQKRRKKCL